MDCLLEIKGLQKSFLNHEQQRIPVVDIAHFAVASSAQLGIEGSSGSGKTTFLHLIAGILQPDAGEIRFQGKDVAFLPEERRDAWRAAHIGYVFQTFNLLQGYSALENVLLGMSFGAGIDAAWGKYLLGRVGLSDRMGYLPRQLSVGQQQRVAVARALANRPKLVLADEPTGNLDAHASEQTLRLIQDICHENNAALVLVSHDREILKRFSSVVSMASVNAVGKAGTR